MVLVPHMDERINPNQLANIHLPKKLMGKNMVFSRTIPALYRSLSIGKKFQQSKSVTYIQMINDK
jgi:hypothetical protein